MSARHPFDLSPPPDRQWSVVAVDFASARAGGGLAVTLLSPQGHQVTRPGDGPTLTEALAAAVTAATGEELRVEHARLDSSYRDDDPVTRAHVVVREGPERRVAAFGTDRNASQAVLTALLSVVARRQEDRKWQESRRRSVHAASWKPPVLVRSDIAAMAR